MNKFTRVLATTAVAAVVGLGMSASAMAADTTDNTKDVDVTVTQGAGVFAYGFEAPSNAVTGSTEVTLFGASGTAQLGSVVVDITDSRLAPTSWNVTIASSLLDGDSTDGTIGAANVVLNGITTSGTDLTSGSPTLIDGATSATLESAKNVVSKEATGNAQISRVLDIDVTVPWDTAADTYSGTLTLSGTEETP